METNDRVEATRQKLNKVYLRLAYGKSDIEIAKKEVNDILTTHEREVTCQTIKKILENVDDETRQDLESYTFIQQLLPEAK